MAERTPWWKSFTIWKKGSHGSKDHGTVQQDTTTETQSVGATTQTTTSKSSADLPINSSFIKIETYDDSELGPGFSENRNTRIMRISRSGRFKEKRRIRASIPENNNYREGTNAAAGQESVR